MWIRERLDPNSDFLFWLRKRALMESQMRDEQEEAIRRRAYALWEEEGRPEGKQLEHWLRAEAEISGKKYAGVTNDGKLIESSSGAADPTPTRKSRPR